MKQQLEALVSEMVDKGILFNDAKREFEKRFIARVLQRHKGNLSRAAQDLKIHRNTLGKKIEEFKTPAVTRAPTGHRSRPDRGEATGSGAPRSLRPPGGLGDGVPQDKESQATAEGSRLGCFVSAPTMAARVSAARAPRPLREDRDPR